MWNFGDLASAFWALTIAIYSVMFGIYNKDYKYFEVVAHICCWGGAALFSFLGFSQPTASSDYAPYYDDTGQHVWCWVSPYYLTQRITLLYLWIFIVMILLIIAYSIMGYKLNQIIKKSLNMERESVKQSKHIKTVFRKMAGYPFVFFVVFAPITVDRLLINVNVPFNYLMFAISIYASNGFWNSILYFITRKIYLKYAVLFKYGLSKAIARRETMTDKSDKSGVTPIGLETQSKFLDANIEQISPENSLQYVSEQDSHLSVSVDQ